MSKSHRGRGLWNTPGRGRGTCPICNATKIKCLYPVKRGDEQIKVCKRCKNK